MLLDLADPAQQRFQADFAALFENVTIKDGRQVSVHWQRPHVRPEALLRLSLVGLVDPEDSQMLPGVYRAVAEPANKQEMTYDLPERSENSFGPQVIVERVFENEGAALAVLQKGIVSVLDQVAPWQVDSLRAYPQVAVASYRMPTVHVLQLNYAKPLLTRREFRPAALRSMGPPQNRGRGQRSR